MTDRRNLGVRHISDSRESRSRTSKDTQKKMITKRRMLGLKQYQSPSYHTSCKVRKDFTTPKRRLRIRFSGCYSGDSPNNEAESPQDIIWDTNSPTQNLNGHGDVRVIEISEIVSRIAPKVKKANEGDSVLQWIGDGAIPCTPEIRQPRVRRISAQSKPPASAQNHTTDKLLKTSPVDKVKQQTHSSQDSRQVELDRMTKDCGVSSQTTSAQLDGFSEEDMKSLFDSDALWNEEADDDLLCQACDDVEKLSASQEQQRRNEEYKKFAHSFTSKALNSSAATICAQSMDINNKGQPQEPTNSSCILARSNSVPCSSSSSGLGSLSARHYGHTQGKSALGPRLGSVRATSQTVRTHSATVGNASNTHHYTFKRHLSDSMTLTNKVFISSHTTAKCSAAEIERKKQEAIARRRLWMQAWQKNGAPT